MEDQWIRAMLFQGEAQIFAISGREIVRRAQEIHRASRTVTAALGRALLMTCMLSGRFKSAGHSVTVHISGGGPAGRIVCVGQDLRVKGYADAPEAELPLKPDGKLDVGGVVGRNGTLSVIQDLSMKEPYIGRCALVSGEIAEDFSRYLLQSEQQNSLVYLGVRLMPEDGRVRAAAGVFIQPMPGCSERTIAALEAKQEEIAGLAARLDEGGALEKTLLTLFPGAIAVLERRTPRFACDCCRERLERVLIGMGGEELRAMIEEDGGAQLTCHFCNTRYPFSRADLEKLLREAAQA